MRSYDTRGYGRHEETSCDSKNCPGQARREDSPHGLHVQVRPTRERWQVPAQAQDTVVAQAQDAVVAQAQDAAQAQDPVAQAQDTCRSRGRGRDQEGRDGRSLDLDEHQAEDRAHHEDHGGPRHRGAGGVPDVRRDPPFVGRHPRGSDATRRRGQRPHPARGGRRCRKDSRDARVLYGNRQGGQERGVDRTPGTKHPVEPGVDRTDDPQDVLSARPQHCGDAVPAAEHRRVPPANEQGLRLRGVDARLGYGAGGQGPGEPPGSRGGLELRVPERRAGSGSSWDAVRALEDQVRRSDEGVQPVVRRGRADQEAPQPRGPARHERSRDAA